MRTTLPAKRSCANGGRTCWSVILTTIQISHVKVPTSHCANSKACVCPKHRCVGGTARAPNICSRIAFAAGIETVFAAFGGAERFVSLSHDRITRTFGLHQRLRTPVEEGRNRGSCFRLHTNRRLS